jgi:hypothetical protein
VTRASTLLVNQNWHPGWRASVGSVRSEDGLLAVDLPPGEHDVVVTFRPRIVLTGATVTGVALVVLVVLGIRARRGLRPLTRRTWVATTVLVALPWATAAAFAATWTEPRFPPPPLRNANGTPAIVDVLPPDAARIGARVDMPVVLEGARVAMTGTNANILTIDLFLRRTGRMPRTNTVFVHFERRGRAPEEKPPEGKHDFYNLDHQVVGGSFYLSDAPEGALVDDAMAVSTHAALPGTYDVFVAFGHVSGRRGRASVADPGSAEVDDGRLRVGTVVVR